MLVIAAYKLLFGDFAGTPGLPGLVSLLHHEWVTLGNLLGLLLGFALLADHFERSRITDLLPRILPDDWKGGFCLLLIILVLSSFLDNIAAAMIGGAGSVVGDTTTTMMWIAGVAPGQVFEAYAGALAATLVYGVAAARQQQAWQPIMKDNPVGVRLDFRRLVIVALILLSAIGTNIYLNLHNPELLEHWPLIGLSVWVALLATAGWRPPTWSLLPAALRGSVFLLSLVLCAAMM